MMDDIDELKLRLARAEDMRTTMARWRTVKALTYIASLIVVLACARWLLNWYADLESLRIRGEIEKARAIAERVAPRTPATTDAGRADLALATLTAVTNAPLPEPQKKAMFDSLLRFYIDIGTLPKTVEKLGGVAQDGLKTATAGLTVLHDMLRSSEPPSGSSGSCCCPPLACNSARCLAPMPKTAQGVSPVRPAAKKTPAPAKRCEDVDKAPAAATSSGKM